MNLAFVVTEPLVDHDAAIFRAMLRAAELPEQQTVWVADDTLAERVAKAQPNVIVPLGKALEAFLGPTGTGNYRGAVSAAKLVSPGHKLVPTFHPEVIRKQWRMLPIAVGDLIKAQGEALRGPQIVYPKRFVYVEPDLEDIYAFKQRCFESPLLSSDIETGWGQITCIAFAPDEQTAICIPFVDMRKPNKSYWSSAEKEFCAWKEVREICECPAPKVGQNLTYDVQWLLRKKGIIVRNYRYDTRLQHKVMYPELPADLANMAASYTRIGSYKQWGGRYQQEKKDG